MAAALRVQDDTVVRSYLSTIDPVEVVNAFEHASAVNARELAETPPSILDLASAGRLVASLGQAVRCISLNLDSLGGSAEEKWQAIGVLDDAGNGLTLVGAALENTDIAADRVSVLLSDEAVLHARRALTQAVQNLVAGIWSFGNGRSMEDAVAKRMAADLALLPPG